MVTIVPATTEQLVELDVIRAAAFAPVFASFRALMGDTIYDIAQARDDAAQGAFLASMFQPDSGWRVYVAREGERSVGFVSVKLDAERSVGELGLNAVDPAHAGKGIGTQMYDFALAEMRAAGMRVAMVGTGGDPSHAPARAAYRKVGFDREIPSVWMYRAL